MATYTLTYELMRRLAWRTQRVTAALAAGLWGVALPVAASAHPGAQDPRARIAEELYYLGVWRCGRRVEIPLTLTERSGGR